MSRDRILEFDHIVVGAGAAGCVVAHRLSRDPTVKVLVLEAGGDSALPDEQVPLHAASLQGSEANWAYETVPQDALGGRRISVAAGRGLGGGGRINYLLWLHGNPDDYDTWASRHGMTGWNWQSVSGLFTPAGPGNLAESDDLAVPVLGVRAPETIHRLTRRFLESAQVVGLPANDDFNEGVQEGAGLYASLIRHGERDNTRRAYLDPVRTRPNLTILTGSSVTRVTLENRQVRGVNYRQPDGQLVAATAPSVVLCAGPVRSPQLLMLSGVGPAAHLKDHGISVISDLPGVGQNLHDHANVALSWGVGTEDALWVDDDHEAARRRWDLDRTGPLATLIEAGAFLHSGRSDSRFDGRSDGRPDSRAEDRPDLQLTLMLADFTGRRPRGVSCVVSLITPDSRGKVLLNSADPADAPLVDPAYLSHHGDVERLRSGVAAAERIFAARPLADAVADPDTSVHSPGVEQFLRNNLFSISHPVGTCRAGDGEDAVVDADLCVYGVTGLRVIDSSVMPAITRGNPYAATVMIGRRGSDLLARRSDPTPKP